MAKNSRGVIQKDLFWEKNVDIVTTFLATNGQIQVALVTAYSTAIAFLTTWGSALQADTKNLIFGTVVPVFSLGILVLAINVYSWIGLQLKYLDDATHANANPSEFRSYFEFRRKLNELWESMTLFERIKLSAKEGIWYYISMPTKIRDIYCYYFLIYIVAPLISLSYVECGKTLFYHIALLVLAQIVLVTYGLRDRFALQYESNIRDETNED